MQRITEQRTIAPRQILMHFRIQMFGKTIQGFEIEGVEIEGVVSLLGNLLFLGFGFPVACSCAVGKDQPLDLNPLVLNPLDCLTDPTNPWPGPGGFCFEP